MKKRILSLLLALLMLTLVGCGGELQDTLMEVAGEAAESVLTELLTDAEKNEAQTETKAPEQPVGTEQPTAEPAEEPEIVNELPDEHGFYYEKDDVAAYLWAYKHLPDNYLTKNEAQKLGWDNKKGNLWEVTDGGCIGGDHFGNYEGLLPKGSWTECDVNYDGGYRGSDRLIFNRDVDAIYYTGDHYKSFTLLYGEE